MPAIATGTARTRTTPAPSLCSKFDLDDSVTTVPSDEAVTDVDRPVGANSHTTPMTIAHASAPNAHRDATLPDGRRVT